MAGHSNFTKMKTPHKNETKNKNNTEIRKCGTCFCIQNRTSQKPTTEQRFYSC